MFDENLVSPTAPADRIPFTDVNMSIPVVIVDKAHFSRAHSDFYEAVADFGHWLEIYGGAGEVMGGVVQRQFAAQPFVRHGRGFKVASCRWYNEKLNVIVVDDGDEVHVHLMPDTVPNYREYGDWDNFRIAPMRDRLKKVLDVWL